MQKELLTSYSQVWILQTFLSLMSISCSRLMIRSFSPSAAALEGGSNSGFVADPGLPPASITDDPENWFEELADEYAVVNELADGEGGGRRREATSKKGCSPAAADEVGNGGGGEERYA